MENEAKEEKQHLTIKEIEHVEKATDICRKVGIGSAIFSGLIFLAGIVGIELTIKNAYPLWNKILGYVLSTGALVGGAFLGKFSHYALTETKKFQKEIEEEKEYHKKHGK